ncbi:alanine racemase [Leptolyngbya sp. FACHB-261]|uniref:alanine racemase n=1 Tax=Leptolyngbya sp. FACHB-261 TaxID=2692806 RepID=UPI0016869AF8|nr:alanine racemase [Leptolyngbya sp. FACHB-261]MBD2104370.1 alanine racemase [Leptolyngbya sp. FACHB-261]
MQNWELTHRAWVEVDLNALEHNVRALRGLLKPSTELLAVVKADAYGHGAVTVSQSALAAGATWLGVATLPEGLELRAAGIPAPILLLGATNTPEEVQAVAQAQLQPTICTPKQALTYAETLATPLAVHLKIDTGMSRLGTSWQSALEFVQLVQRLPNLKIASIYSHLATADDPNPALMQLQQQRFEQVVAQVRSAGLTEQRLHLANSAATLADPDLHYDLVRTGLALYGLYSAPHLSLHVDLRPVLQVRARITQVKTIAPGTGVSYGHLFVASQETRVATVAIGYADGVPRLLSNRLQAIVRGVRVPQIGAITMDQCMIDVTAVPDAQEGEVVTFLGEDGAEQISAEDWAEALGTISWEILCGFKHRLPRVTVRRAPQFEQSAPSSR